MICPECGLEFQGGRFYCSNTPGTFRRCPKGHEFKEPVKKKNDGWNLMSVTPLDDNLILLFFSDIPEDNPQRFKIIHSNFFENCKTASYWKYLKSPKI